MARSERVNRAVGIVLGALALAGMTLAFGGVSIRDILHSLMK